LQQEQADADRGNPAFRYLRPPPWWHLTEAQKDQARRFGWCDLRERVSFAEMAYRKRAGRHPGENGATNMFGKRKTAGGEFLPVLKFNLSEGVISKALREKDDDGEWVTKWLPLDVGDFEAVLDVDHILIGWLKYKPLDFRLVPAGEDHGARPAEGYQEGFVARLWLRGEHSGPCEVTSTSLNMWVAFDLLGDEVAVARAKHKGMVPVIGIAEMTRCENNDGEPYYKPAFEIVGWAQLPEEFKTPPATTRGGNGGKRKSADMEEEITL
jgi:hypothetical protein